MLSLISSMVIGSGIGAISWCGPCRALAPRMDRLAAQYSGKIKFVKVNVDEAQGRAQRFQIEGIPTLLLFKNGKLADRFVGLPPGDALNSQLNSLVGTSGGPPI